MQEPMPNITELILPLGGGRGSEMMLFAHGKCQVSLRLLLKKVVKCYSLRIVWFTVPIFFPEVISALFDKTEVVEERWEEREREGKFCIGPWP